ncbi:MAG: hypothetical protein FJZ96_02030 [Chloroflexi bacterium]|nr:hypothetical protein [Chloroflexota bacterium]
MNLLTLIVGLVALVAGWLIGFFDSNLRTRKKIEAAENQARAATESAHAQVETTRLQTETAARPAGVDNLLKVCRGPGKGLTLELDGQPLEPGSIGPADRKRLVDLLTQLRPWVDQAAGTHPPEPASLPPEAEKPLMHSLVAAAVAGRPTTATAPVASQASMIDQINAILQTRLAGTPLAGRGIRVQESLEGIVHVYVGLKRYEGIEAVPEQEVKAAIRQAVAEWEKGRI